MPTIDRTQYNALIDDDGSNTVGTPWTKNIVKIVLLDPIDVLAALLAPLASPTLTGTPTAPTPSAGDSSTKVATTAFVATSFAPKASPAFTGLVDISAASAGQVKFPATQNPSSDVNTLDDYEEGTWTPSLGGNTTYTTQVGRYTKVGRLVHLEFNITVNVIGTGSAGVITGLPFAAAVTAAGAVAVFTSSAQSLVFASCYALSTSIQITGLAAAGTSTGNAVPFGNGTTVNGSVTFSV